MNLIKIGAAISFGVAAFFLGGPNIPAQVPTSSRSEAAAVRQTPDIEAALHAKKLSLGAPIFLRIIKTRNGQGRDGYLEAFAENSQGEFIHFKTWDICTWSGVLGPKKRQGDRQSPEGFYFVRPSQMNPNSSYHLSFNLGYPNAYDRSHGRTGDFLMVHGDCVSIGCYAMTDQGIEEIYTLMSAAFDGGQPFVRVHIFPFPMTDELLARHAGAENDLFWRNLKQGWDAFEKAARPPNVTVRSKTYMFGEN